MGDHKSIANIFQYTSMHARMRVCSISGSLATHKHTNLQGGHCLNDSHLVRLSEVEISPNHAQPTVT